MSATTFDTNNSFPVTEVPSLIPGRPSVQTIWRWIGNGITGNNGETIKLASFKAGGRRFVSREAIQDFLAASNGTHRESISC